MITVHSILAPSQKITDEKSESKGKSKAAKIVISKITDKPIIETTTYSTIIVVDGKYISLSVIKHFGYQKPYELNHKLPVPKNVDLFEEIFYWPLEDFINSKLNKIAYKQITETDFYYKSKLLYELNWEVINVNIENRQFTISNKEKNYTGAIPENSLGEPRYDYITDDCHYKYNCKIGEYKGRAIEIIITKQ